MSTTKIPLSNAMDHGLSNEYCCAEEKSLLTVLIAPEVISQVPIHFRKAVKNQIGLLELKYCFSENIYGPCAVDFK